MPHGKHASGKAIEDWRGSRSTPLDQIPRVANLGGRVQKGEVNRCQMVVVRIASTRRKKQIYGLPVVRRNVAGIDLGGNDTGCALQSRGASAEKLRTSELPRRSSFE